MAFTTTTPFSGPNTSPFTAGGSVFSNPGVNFDRSRLTSSAQVSNRKAAPRAPKIALGALGGGTAGKVEAPPLISPPPPVEPPTPPAMMGLRNAMGGADAGGDAIGMELGTLRQNLGPRSYAPLSSVAALQQLKVY